jgi:tetraacyldisaccharide 4'-kinase
MKYLRWLLFPFSLLYGLAVIIRNWFYDAGLFKSDRFNVPVISVGNLDVGGAGKSPMTEYLIRLLKDNYKLATLSRGYGRKTKGYVDAAGTVMQQSLPTHYSPLTTAGQLGDEPAQFHHKFPAITVAVCEKRAEGIKRLLPAHEAILMDDAYQHRAVTPGLSILLFDYNRVYEPHLLLPAGNMREPFSGRWRAGIIIVTKCPDTLTVDEQTRLVERLEPLPYQHLFFTSIAYQPLQDREGRPMDAVIDSDTTVFLLTGIANAQPLLQHINGYTPHIIHHNYPDHHQFTLKNITKLAGEYSACASQKKIIITTEKDAQRLGEQELLPVVNQLPFLVLPIGLSFLNDDQGRFDQIVIKYVREHSANNSLY